MTRGEKVGRAQRAAWDLTNCARAGIVNNRDLPRFVRYNAMQSILLDIILMCVAQPFTPLFWTEAEGMKGL